MTQPHTSTETQAQAKPAKPKAAQKGNGFFADYGAFPNPPVPGEWLASSEILLTSAFDLTRQCIEFGEARMHEDFKTLGKLMGCKDMSQIADCHRAFAEKAQKQYMDQFKSISRHLAGMMDKQPETGAADVTQLPD